jgi:hypothetical protein
MLRSLSAVALFVITLSACAPEMPTPGGAQFFAQNCSSCHGAKALGDGPRAADFDVPPPNLTELSALNGGIFPTEAVFAQIYGYSGRHQFGGMPDFGPDFGGPMVDWVSRSGEVIPTPRALVELAEYIESVQR